jgi:hypothetical protein
MIGVTFQWRMNVPGEIPLCTEECSGIVLDFRLRDLRNSASFRDFAKRENRRIAIFKLTRQIFEYLVIKRVWQVV